MGKCCSLGDEDLVCFEKQFLWQEGHTAHATKVEAVEESEKMMNVYADFAQNFSDSGCKGIKTETERFVGRGNILYRSINAGKHYKQERPII
jgi:hypothetical protein